MASGVVWGLIAVSVFGKANSDIRTDTDHFLTWGSESLGIGIHKFRVSESWGKEDELRDFFSKQKLIRVKMVFPKSK